MKKTIGIILTIALLCVVGWGIYAWREAQKARSTIVEATPARIVDIAPMVKLLTVTIREDIPVKGEIGTRHLFARQTITGAISFDMEEAWPVAEGDTVRVYLPREELIVRESTEPGSYRVIDRWNTRPLRGSNFTTEEENAIKERAREEWIGRLYGRGVVGRARVDARSRLEAMLTPVFAGKVVEVLDTVPPRLLARP